MTFEEAVATISALEGRGWRLGLDRMREFLRRAGLADATGVTPTPQFLHVAGTNGKGSTTAFLHAMLQAQGYRTGAFFSPFVYSVRERVQGDTLISPTEFARLTEALLPIARGMETTEWNGPTEFEFKTALGFAYWAAIRAEWVALEVGLGGRLDATNLVSPAATGIVSIGLDHIAILGNTAEEIAREKAGIIKPGVPVVVGRMADGPRQEIEAIAAARDAPCWRIDREVQVQEVADGTVTVQTPNGTYPGLAPKLVGAMQPHNLAVAVAMMDAGRAIRDPAAIAHGAAQAFAPGRYQRATARGVEWILDGAHNVDSAEVLAQSLSRQFGSPLPMVAISSMIQGHELAPFFGAIRAWLGPVHVPPIDFNRARQPEEVGKWMTAFGLDAVAHDALDSALDAAIAQARALGVPILVTGSFYLVGAVGRSLEIGTA